MQLTPEGVRAVAQRLWRVDDVGLTELDYLYLQALEGGPRGLPALQQLLPVSAEEITTDIEPFLAEIGSVQIAPRGRNLTARGEQLLHLHRSSFATAVEDHLVE